MASILETLAQAKKSLSEKRGYRSFRLEYPYQFYLKAKEDEGLLKYKSDLLKEEIAWMQLISADQPEIRTTTQLPIHKEEHQRWLREAIERHADTCKYILDNVRRFQRTSSQVLNSYRHKTLRVLTSG